MLKSYAPAKINLILKVLGKREDGYHEIFSLMERVSLFDTLYFRPISVPRIELKTNCPFLPTDKSNLIYRAASLFLSYASMINETGFKQSLSFALRVYMFIKND